MGELALGLDLGTTGVRVVAVDTAGKLVAEVTRDYPLLTPRPGWTEQDPAAWKNATLEALRELNKSLGGSEIVVLGLSGQMHGMVPLDASGDVVRPAILWNDQRTGEAVAELERAVPRSELIARTGNPAITGFHLPKILWLRAVEPEAYDRTCHSLLPKDYIGYLLTGIMAAEPSDASGTNAFHLGTKRWDTEVLDAVGLDPKLFPDLVASDEIIGSLTVEVAHFTGLPKGLPVVAGAGDNAAAATGLGLSSANPSLGSVSLGTSGAIFAPLTTATPDPEGRVHLFCHADGGYHLLAVTLAAAGSLRWYRDTFSAGSEYSALTAAAASSPAGANGVTFRPYLAGERTPHMNPDLRGSFSGLSLATNKADTIRSVLEGVAFSLRDALDVVLPLAPLGRAILTGGGSRSDLWLQIISDVLHLPLVRTSADQGAAYGAALLALQGAGLVKRAAEAASTNVTSRFEPDGSEVYAEPLKKYRVGNA
jgi:xylulokinase